MLCSTISIKMHLHNFAFSLQFGIRVYIPRSILYLRLILICIIKIVVHLACQKAKRWVTEQRMQSPIFVLFCFLDLAIRFCPLLYQNLHFSNSYKEHHLATQVLILVLKLLLLSYSLSLGIRNLTLLLIWLQIVIYDLWYMIDTIDLWFMIYYDHDLWYMIYRMEIFVFTIISLQSINYSRIYISIFQSISDWEYD